MTACQVMTETPPEQGFGEAALEMTTVMVMKTDAPGFRVGRLVQFDVRFNPATGKHSSQRPVQAGPVKLATDKPTPE